MIINTKHNRTQAQYIRLWMMKKALIPGQIIILILFFRKKWLKFNTQKQINNQIDKKENNISNTIKKKIKLKIIINDF